VKVFISSLLLSVAALGQTIDGAKVITFNRADTEHCKVITVDNKPLLETTYDGTTVAVGIPTKWGNGEFSVYVSVRQAGAGVVEVNPKQIYALYSDAAHTRLERFDKGHEIDLWESEREAGPFGGPPKGSGGPGGFTPGSGNAGPPPLDPRHPLVFLRRASLKQGSRVAGDVFVRKPKGVSLHVGPNDSLSEIDIPVNGVLFRF
jgi:hypothetical protein